jgi:hypothetical protein
MGAKWFLLGVWAAFSEKGLDIIKNSIAKYREETKPTGLGGWIMKQVAAQYEMSGPTRPKWVQWVKIIIVPIVPAIVGLLYQPINQGYVVKVLGCGCVDGFNANSFSGVLFPGVFVVSVGLLVWASRRMSGRKYVVYIVGALILQNITCYFAWKYSLWR